MGFVGIDRAEREPQQDEILRHDPRTRSLPSIVVRMAQAPVRGKPRSIADLAFLRAGHATDDVRARIVARLQDRGIRAVKTQPDIAQRRAHICGPTSMMDANKKIRLDLGVPAGQVRTEAFGTDRRDPTRQAAIDRPA